MRWNIGYLIFIGYIGLMHWYLIFDAVASKIGRIELSTTAGCKAVYCMYIAQKTTTKVHMTAFVIILSAHGGTVWLSVL